jgi:hypothetical protein
MLARAAGGRALQAVPRQLLFALTDGSHHSVLSRVMSVSAAPG